VTRHRFVAVVVSAMLLASACTRSGTDTNTEGTTSSTSAGGATTTTAATDATALAQGGFGDLAAVCAPGDASGATDIGVTDTEIHVGTITDKSSTVRPGLDKEMYDAAVGFANWCNDHGGINGRKIVVDDRDAALFDYPGQIQAACTADLAVVGGGAVLDDADAGARVACGLPNIPGYVVTDAARTATLQVQPLPNPPGAVATGLFNRGRAVHPDLTKLGIMTGSLATTQAVRDADLKALESVGYTTVYNREYNIACEPDWTSFVNDMKTAGVQVLHFIGEPECLEALQKAFQTANWYPQLSLETANMYDQKYATEGGKYAKDTYTSSAFYPFEAAADNKATQDYLDMMKQYNPDGKVALLGLQATSAYLLFATAAAQCGSDLTRQCLLDKASAVTSWTGGGLHGETNPSANTGTTCFVALKVEDGTFGVDTDFTAPTPGDGIFNCDPANASTATG
jgi:hypothetical protein